MTSADMNTSFKLVLVDCHNMTYNVSYSVIENIDYIKSAIEDCEANEEEYEIPIATITEPFRKLFEIIIEIDTKKQDLAINKMFQEQEYAEIMKLMNLCDYLKYDKLLDIIISKFVNILLLNKTQEELKIIFEI